ncbi:MAG: DUF1223 domain-containing protein [Cognatishimia sp.]|uniref:DUF1223 domain-containing protein n=1 Tax=Cognatishimia sp. TaxID=2211648 RepID=UPI003B8B7305
MTALKRWVGIAAFSVAGAFASLATAGEHPVVVELYTSQGCSSCPPADAYFGQELVGRDDIIALALHVDYWDYIGWKDDFANPAYTKRQRGYAQAARKRSIYTPQMVIGGVDHVVGNRPADVRANLAKHSDDGSDIDLVVTRNGDRLTITLDSKTNQRDPMVVQLVRYSKKETRNIKRGENAGRTLNYHNIVTHWETVGDWNARRAKTITAKAPGDAPVVVIVQRKGFGPIVAAAELR